MLETEHARSFTTEDLRDIVRDAPTDDPVVIDFWEPRCTACRATLQTIDGLACRVENRGVVGTFNVRNDPETARALGMETVPTLMIFRQGAVDDKLTGAETIQNFVDRIDETVFFGEPPTCDS